MTPLYIIDGARTPFCKMSTDLEALTADDLGRHATAAVLTRTGIDPASLDEVIFGCVGQPVEAANIARIISLRSGIPAMVPACTVHRNCASGMEAVTTAHQRMVSGNGELFLVGGTESMSRIPLLFPHDTSRKFSGLSRAKHPLDKARSLAEFRAADFQPRIALQLGLTDPFSGMIMGDTAEILAREYRITREAQDAFAAASHSKALAERMHSREEIAPVYMDGHVISDDNGIREDSTPANLAKLRPIFDRQTGTVTAGNSSQITDGAVALLVGSEAAVKKLGIEPLGMLIGYAYTGCDPERMGLGPVHAIEKARASTGLGISDADVIELNEAFAAQALAVLAALNDPAHHGFSHAPQPLDPMQINRRGGSIALGHPVGATGARLILSSLRQLQKSGGKRALVTLCVGGGQGAALWLERP